MTLKQDLVRHERREKHMYQDSEGIWTIGVGYNIQHRGLPDDIIDELFRRDVQEAINICSRTFYNWARIPQEKKDILANMAFNLGETRLKGFQRMITAVEKEDWQEAAAEMMDSKWFRQVKTRGLELVTRMRGDHDI